MSFYDDASLVVIPSAQKTSKLYSVKPTDGSGDLAFTRTGDTATRVNSAGLIEPVLANVPRLDYLGSTCPRLLLEPQRTNLALYSEQFDNAYWGKARCTVSANVATSPDGYVNADGLVEDTTNNSHPVYRGFTFTNATAYTFSIFAKKGSRRYLRINLTNGGSPVYYDFDTKTAGSGGSVVDYGNGWLRLIYTYTTNNTSGEVYIEPSITGTTATYLGNGSTSVYLYGAALEIGAYATSYIPTLAAAVTRGAEECSKTGISSLIGQTAGSVFVESYVGSGPASMPFWLRKLSGGLYGDLITVQTINNIPQFEVYTGGVSIVYIVGSTPLSNGFHKFAVAYANNDFVFYVDGVQIGTDTSGTPPTCDELYIDQYIDGGNRNATKKQVMLFKTRLTNAQLAELTTL